MQVEYSYQVLQDKMYIAFQLIYWLKAPTCPRRLQQMYAWARGAMCCMLFMTWDEIAILWRLTVWCSAKLTQSTTRFQVWQSQTGIRCILIFSSQEARFLKDINCLGLEEVESVDLWWTITVNSKITLKCEVWIFDECRLFLTISLIPNDLAILSHMRCGHNAPSHSRYGQRLVL